MGIIISFSCLKCHNLIAHSAGGIDFSIFGHCKTVAKSIINTSPFLEIYLTFLG